MPAAPGSALTLNAAPQPAIAQSGGALALARATAPSTRLGGQTQAGWPDAVAVQSLTVTPWSHATESDQHAAAPWGHGAPRDRHATTPWPAAHQIDATARAPWGQFARLHQARHAAPWPGSRQVDAQATTPWARYATHHQARHAAPWPGSRQVDAQATTPWARHATHHQAAAVLFWSPPVPRDASLRAPWGRFVRRADGGVVVVTPPTVDEHGTVIIPRQEIYVIHNTVTAVRLDTSQPVQIHDFSAEIDADSYTWSWSAGCWSDQLPAVASPGPGEYHTLLVTLNGHPIRLLIERTQRDRRFADDRLRLTGRGLAAWLDEPVSPVLTYTNTETRTAQQLLNDALTENGVSIGWDVDWNLTDWPVLAGAWHHTGTHISAALRLAEAGGATLHGHDTAQTLILAPRYPLAPWDWPEATIDLEIPDALAEYEGTETRDQPDYNAVWVHGEIPGARRDRILRAGSAADRYAPLIVEPLATDPQATRQRGIPALANTGRQRWITLRLPITAETGLIKPGLFVRYEAEGVQRIGLTRALKISHTHPELWQHVTIESHDL